MGCSSTSSLTSLLGMRGLTYRMGMRSSHPCTARGLTCPRKMYAHHDLLAHQRVGLDRADQRKIGEASKRERLKSYIWPLSHWVYERPTQEDCGVACTHLCQWQPCGGEAYCVRCQNKLVMTGRYMRGFVLMPDDERQTFCRVLLEDISR